MSNPYLSESVVSQSWLNKIIMDISVVQEKPYIIVDMSSQTYRNHSSRIVYRKEETAIFDCCGEGKKQG